MPVAAQVLCGYNAGVRRNGSFTPRLLAEEHKEKKRGGYSLKMLKPSRKPRPNSRLVYCDFMPYIPSIPLVVSFMEQIVQLVRRISLRQGNGEIDFNANKSLLGFSTSGFARICGVLVVYLRFITITVVGPGCSATLRNSVTTNLIICAWLSIEFLENASRESS